MAGGFPLCLAGLVGGWLIGSGKETDNVEIKINKE